MVQYPPPAGTRESLLLVRLACLVQAGSAIFVKKLTNLLSIQSALKCRINILFDGIKPAGPTVRFIFVWLPTWRLRTNTNISYSRKIWNQCIPPAIELNKRMLFQMSSMHENVNTTRIARQHGAEAEMAFPRDWQPPLLPFNPVRPCLHLSTIKQRPLRK